MTIHEIENPNSSKLKISGIKYASDAIDDSIPKPLPQGVFFWMLIGKAGSGKTTFLLNLLAKKGRFYNRKFDKVFVFSPSIFSGKLVNVIVEEDSELTRGETVVDWLGVTNRKPNCFVMDKADDKKFFQLLKNKLATLP